MLSRTLQPTISREVTVLFLSFILCIKLIANVLMGLITIHVKSNYCNSYGNFVYFNIRIIIIFQSRVSKLNEQLESEKLDLLSVVERKNQEIDRLNGQKIY